MENKWLIIIINEKEKQLSQYKTQKTKNNQKKLQKNYKQINKGL